MTSRKSACIILTTVASVTALSLAYVAAHGARDTDLCTTPQRTYVNIDAGRKELPAGAHGKIAPPAEIQVEVADAGEIDGPVRLAIHATSLVPVRSATISIAVSQIGAKPGLPEPLWSRITSGFLAETVEYTTDPLPVGKYRFTAILEFVPDGLDAEALFVAESLCLDAGPDTLYASDVSFDHIQRIRLRQELEDRALVNPKTQLAQVDRKTITRRIEELNRVKEEPAIGGKKSLAPLSETQDEPAMSSSPPRTGPPAQEVAVPVREKNAP